MRLKAIPVFLAMGLADAIGLFGRLAKDGYQLSNANSLNPSAVQWSFLVPLAAILYITWTAVLNRKQVEV